MVRSIRRWLGREVYRYHQGVELVSIHVPKTAGTSFKEVLRDNYRKEQILFAYDELALPYWEGMDMYLDSPTRIIHGHIPATKAMKLVYSNAKFIAWVRNPVDRVISYYHFWKKSEPHGNVIHDAFLASNMGLLEFAQQPYLKHEMSSYFGDLQLEDFFFIGLTEQFEQDLQLLSGKLGWEVDIIPHKNVGNKPKVENNIRIKLEQILSREMELYQRILNHRQQCSE